VRWYDCRGILWQVGDRGQLEDGALYV
jgi:hypothetical protein